MAWLVGRILLVPIGFIAACLAISLFVHLVVLAGMEPALDPQLQELLRYASLLTVPVLAGWIGYYLLIPAMILIVLAEALSTRDGLAHLLAGMGATLFAAQSFTRAQDLPSNDGGLMAVAAAAGIVGGWVYWIIAGRLAGRKPRGDLAS